MSSGQPQEHDFQAFYDQELGFRRQEGYPPFGSWCGWNTATTIHGKAEQLPRSLAGQIQAWMDEEGGRATRMIGPAPCFFSRMSGYYRWQIVLCGPDPAGLLSDRPWRLED